MVTPVIAAPRQSRTVFERLRGGDEVAYAVTCFFALLVLVLTGALLWGLWVHSDLTRQKFGFGFVTSTTWNPGDADQYGALPFIYGTLSSLY